MSNHKTKRRDGPTSDYVRPLTTEEKERGVKVHPLPDKSEKSKKVGEETNGLQYRVMMHYPMSEFVTSSSSCSIFSSRRAAMRNLKGECKGNSLRSGRIEVWRNGHKLDAWQANQLYDATCGMMPDDEWRRVRDHLWTGMAIKEACDLIPESPMVMFGIALKMELDMMAAIWKFEDYGLDDPIATPKIAPAKMQAPAFLPQQLQDVNDVLEQNARKSPVTSEYRALVETTLEAYVRQANGQPIRITAENYIKREGKEVKMFCRFLEGDDRDGILVGVALNADDPARPVYKGPELLAYLELCHKAGVEFRKRMLGKPSTPPFKCQRTGNPPKDIQSAKITPSILSEPMTA